MSWIESHTVLSRHRKLKELAISLRLRPVYMMGHLHALWHAALEQQEDGDLSAWSDEFIADSSQYPGECSQYVRRLQEFGWLDGKLIHDWLEYSGRYLETKYRTRNPKRLMEIWTKHGLVYPKSDQGQTSDIPPDLTRPDLPDQPEKRVLFAALLEAWNVNRGPLRAVELLTDKRKQKLRLRWAEKPDPAYWCEVVRRIAKSSFCTGKNDKGWAADFDWLITNDTNHVKVMEGKYDDRKAFNPHVVPALKQFKESVPKAEDLVEQKQLTDLLSKLKGKSVPKEEPV